MGGGEGACSVDRGHIKVFELSPRRARVTHWGHCFPGHFRVFCSIVSVQGTCSPSDQTSKKGLLVKLFGVQCRYRAVPFSLFSGYSKPFRGTRLLPCYVLESGTGRLCIRRPLSALYHLP